MWIIFIHIVINSKNSTFLNPNPALTIFHNPPSPMADYEYVFLMWLVSILSIHTIVSECCAHHSFWSTAPLSAKSMPIFAHLLGSDRTQKAVSLCIPSSTYNLLSRIWQHYRYHTIRHSEGAFVQLTIICFDELVEEWVLHDSDDALLTLNVSLELYIWNI